MLSFFSIDITIYIFINKLDQLNCTHINQLRLDDFGDIFSLISDFIFTFLHLLREKNVAINTNEETFSSIFLYYVTIIIAPFLVSSISR